MANIFNKKNIAGATTQNTFSQNSSSSTSSGKSWNTSHVSKATANGLKDAERPYSSQYEKALGSAVNAIQNRKNFEYDINKDALYQNAAKQYKLLGQQAMQETMANASALTGGYGSSYATTAGMQAYRAQLDKLSGMMPEYYQQARQNYDSDTNNLYNKANLFAGLESEAYQRWAAQRDYAYGKYNDEWQRNAVSHSQQTENSMQTQRNSNTQMTYSPQGSNLVLPTVEERYNAAHSYNNAKALMDVYGLSGSVSTYKDWKSIEGNKDKTYTDYQNYLSDSLGTIINAAYTKKQRKQSNNKK